MLDDDNGTYSLQYTLEAPGEHALSVLVNGSLLSAGGQLLAAEYGPLVAAQCRASIERPAGARQASTVCGASQAVIIEVGYSYEALCRQSQDNVPGQPNADAETLYCCNDSVCVCAL